MSTKKQRDEFRQEATKLILQASGRRREDHWGWIIETKYGPLRLRIDDFENRHTSREWIGTVFARFEDLKRLPRLFGINGHTGKWNHHYIARNYTVETAIMDFKANLGVVIDGY